MYAWPTRFCVADVSSIGTGQANTVYGTASTIAKEAAKAIKLRYTRAIRNCMVNA